MDVLKARVEAMSEKNRRQLIKDYERLEQEGSIDDTTLRRETEALIDSLGASRHSISLWMGFLAMEVYRHYANRYFDVLRERNGE